MASPKRKLSHRGEGGGRGNNHPASPTDADADADADARLLVSDEAEYSDAEEWDSQSGDVADILREEEEREELLLGSKPGRGAAEGWGKRVFGQKDGESRRKTSSRKSRRPNAGKKANREVMYEMEEGGQVSSGSSSGSELGDTPAHHHAGAPRFPLARRKRRAWKRVLLHLGIGVLFLILLLFAWRASHHDRRRPAAAARPLRSNGTHLFAPTTILISLDGFRADFLQRNLTPALSALMRDGVSPRYMMPSFPSVTFPNHYTIITGLYPEAHGVVGNSFWDPAVAQEFWYTDPARSLEARWWGGQPLWTTAERQGLKAAVHMWPGSEVELAEGEVGISYLDRYNGSEVLERKVQRLLGWLDLPGPEVGLEGGDERPQFIAAYVPNVDADGHRYGPNSTEIRGTIAKVDGMLGDLFAGLEARNLTDVVNVVIVSDHGMATTDTSRLVQFEDLIDPSLVSHTDGWPLYGLRLKDESRLEEVYHDLKKKAADMESIEVYLRDQDMPARYHFRRNARIAPLWLIPRAGWAIVQRAELDLSKLGDGEVYHPRGLHGYDHEHPLMRAIFLARGPAFLGPDAPPGSRLPPFQNTELYNLLCDSLGLEPAPNNGTWRLPLRAEGRHGDGDPAELEDPPADPVSVSVSVASPSAPGSSAPTTATSLPALPASVIPFVPPYLPATPTPVSPVESEAPEAPATGAADEAGKEQDGDARPGSKAGWLQWLTDKLEAAKDWVSGAVGKATGNGSGSRR